MSAPDRRAMVERPGKDLSVRRQCALVGVARSGVYRPKPVAEADDLAVMRRIDELHLELPFYGSRRRCQSNGGSSTCSATAISRAAIYAARARHSAKVAERLCL